MQLREHNRSLDLLFSKYDVAEKELDFMVRSIPYLANVFSELAQYATKQLIDSADFSGSLDLERTTLVAHCFFDLSVASFFSKTYTLIQNADKASLLADSLLFQGTELDPSEVNETEIRFSGTQNARGISKFVAASKLIDIRPIEPWIFGKELSKILHGIGDYSEIMRFFDIGIAYQSAIRNVLEDTFKDFRA